MLVSALDQHLDKVNYADIAAYTPSLSALNLLNLIKAITGGRTENKTPIMHLLMCDEMFYPGEDTINLCFRGAAKTTLMRYIIWYSAVFGELPDLPNFRFGLYVSDTMDNGVKNMSKNLQFEYDMSPFLQQVLPKIHITQQVWEFENSSGYQTLWKGFGASTGVRGATAKLERPTIALLDDLMSDEAAKSGVVVETIETMVNQAVRQALHPTKRKIIWAGTPFNEADPITKAIESGAYRVNVFPVAEKFPVAKEDFRGAWEERFPYEMVLREYEVAKKQHKLPGFYQELMLRVSSEEGRILEPTMFQEYSVVNLMNHRESFNFYITTDLATSEKQHADFSVKIVWAVDANWNIYYVTGMRTQCTMKDNIDHIFELVQRYNPVQNVGLEVSGQQEGFVGWINQTMMQRNIWFTLASTHNSNRPGIRPQGSKVQRLQNIQPWFAEGKMHFPTELQDDPTLQMVKHELLSVTVDGVKSRNDDCLDAVTQLMDLKIWAPGVAAAPVQNELHREIQHGNYFDPVDALDYGYQSNSPLDDYTA